MAFNHFDAAYYLDATLKALKPTTIYTLPAGTTVLKQIPAGSIVGEIRSYILRDGVVWWQLKEGGYVKHVTGQFDAQLAKNTSSGMTNDIIDRTTGSLPDISKLLPSFDNIKAVLLIGVVLVAVYFAFKTFK